MVNGQVRASGDNIHIAGRGILDSKDWGFAAAGIILQLDNVTDSSVAGIIVKDSPTWTSRLFQSDNVSVDNLKILSTHLEEATDGIDVVNSSHIDIRNSFVRSHDDAIAVKGMNFSDGRGDDTITVSNTTLWTDGANGFRIGCESHAAFMRNLTFTNVDLIHYSNYNWVITLQPAENMPLQNIRFQDVRAQLDWGFSGNFIEVQPQVTQWSNPPEGSVDGAYFKNVSMNGYNDGSTRGNIVVVGPSAAHDVRNVTFDNVSRYGQVVTSASAPNVSLSGYTSAIAFGSNAPPPPPAAASAPKAPLGLALK